MAFLSVLRHYWLGDNNDTWLVITLLRLFSKVIFFGSL